VRLWTVQPLEVWDLLRETGVYICDNSKRWGADDEEMTVAYNWLVEQMKEKIGEPPVGVEMPVWAWHTTFGKHKKPNMRNRMFRNDEHKEEVCIEIEIPDSEVVLSNYEAWGYVCMMNSYLPHVSTVEEWNNQHIWFDSLPEEQQLELREKSWQGVFDLTPLPCECEELRLEFTQATFWMLKLENVKKIHYLS